MRGRFRYNDIPEFRPSELLQFRSPSINYYAVNQDINAGLNIDFPSIAQMFLIYFYRVDSKMPNQLSA